MNGWAKVLLAACALGLAGPTACKKKEPDPAVVHLENGDDLLSKQQFKEAAAEYAKSLEANPNQEKVWEKKAYAHMEDGDMDQADAAILKTVDFKPDTASKAEVYRNLANLYLQKATGERAEKYFLEAVKIDPNDDLSLAWLGAISAERGGARSGKAAAIPEHLDKAMGYYDKVIALKPDLPDTYINKRIAAMKYMGYERRAKEEAEERTHDRDKAKREAAKAEVEKHQARIEEFTKLIEELNKQFAEAKKKAPPK